jgi:AraC-like DNA-binding protein
MATIDRYYFSICTTGFEQQGGDANRLLRKAGVDPLLLKQPLWRGSVEAMAKLVRLIWEELGDEAMGFTQYPTPIGSFAYATELAMEGKSVADGLKRGIRFLNLINKSIHTKIEDSVEGLALTFQFTSIDKDPNHYYSEFWMIIWHRLACWLAGETVPLIYADFDYARPNLYIEEFKYLFPCHHNFNCNERRLILDRHVLHAPIRRSPDELQAMIASAPLDIMTIPASDMSMHRQVRQLLVRSPALSTRSIASEFALNTDQLRRKLKSEGQNISVIREFVRRDISIYWLKKSNKSVESIAEELGYAEARSFTRAFRSWTNLSPSEFRKRKE